MLKIKDNFDLKELEKYGFEILETHSSDYYFKRIKDYRDYSFMVKSISRKIVLDTPSNYIENLDTLHDLIKADLVEKVEKE